MAQLTRFEISKIYHGSDGDATKRLYEHLKAIGPRGELAVNLLRAQKCSTRAKVYRGGNGRGSYRQQAYNTKQWAMQNLCTILEQLTYTWGWKLDMGQAVHSWVLYVELPTGQVSFHAEKRLYGPVYGDEWDGSHKSEERILGFAKNLNEEHTK